MIRTWFGNDKEKLASVSLIVALFFSSLIFVGLYSSSSVGQLPAQTEQRFSNHYQLHKRTITYRDIPSSLLNVKGSDISLHHLNLYQKNNLFAYNSAAQVKWDAMLRQFRAYYYICHFRQLRPIPMRPEEDMLKLIKV